MLTSNIYPVSFSTVFSISRSNNKKDYHINKYIWLLNDNFGERYFFPVDLFADMGK